MLILIGIQNLQNIVFSFEKCLNGQNHILSDSHHSIKRPSLTKVTLFGKLCRLGQEVAC